MSENKPTFDMANITNKLRKKFEKKDPKVARKLGVGNDLSGLDEKDFIIMPEWWQMSTNTKGIPFGRTVMIAGKTDSGKTSACIEAMKAAQKQGCGIIYVETEGKTTTEDLVEWGVDPTQMILVQSTIAEEAYEYLFESWDAFTEVYPDAPLLVIIDSVGGVISQRDTDINLKEDSSKPGGKGSINRLLATKIVAKREASNTAVLLVTYTYANIGSVGRTNAGGDALQLSSSLIYQTTRKGWKEKTIKGEKVRVGAIAKWTLYKNHIDKRNPGPKNIEFEITSEGIKYIDGK